MGLVVSAAALLVLAAAAPAANPTPVASPLGDLRIVKTDPSGATVDGATFAVHRDSPQGQLVRSVSAGDIHLSLPLGTYCAVETAPPPGYRLPSGPACATLSAPQPNQVLTFVDQPLPQGGALRVIQTDLSGGTVAAAGAAFRVHAGSPAGAVVATLSTDGSGTATAGGLGPATYCVEQTAVPQGLQLAPQYTPAQCVPVTIGATAIVSVADPPAATPTAAPAPAPSPTAGPTGELQVVKTDTSGQGVTTPGFTFNVRVGSASGQVIATITTDGSGTAVAAALNPATYCVEETAAPDGYQVAPAYSPGACVQVVADLTQGHSPATVTVADPATATPSPASAPQSAGPTQRGITRLVAPGQGSRSLLPRATLARALVGGGGLLLLAGLVMIVLAVRRRRRPPPGYEPPDTWYDSTLT